MDFSNFERMETYISDVRREPLAEEREMGLWVDRTGSSLSADNPRRLRDLALFGAVNVVSGRGMFYSRSSGALELAPGDSVILLPGEPCVYFPADKWWRTQWIVWDGPEARRCAAAGLFDPARPVIRDFRGAVEAAVKEVTPLLSRFDFLSLLEKKSAVLALITEFGGRRAGAFSEKDRLFLEKATRLIEDNLDSALSVPSIAENCGLGEGHFRRLFKSLAGVSPGKFAAERRISLAREMLSRGASVKETAGRLGFRDVFYFMRAFKKMTGVTAGAFAGRRGA
jgi:AraC-like DNA-binding protein